MDNKTVERILKGVRDGSLPVARAVEMLRHLPYTELGFANIDSHRHLRRGAPEVIFCQGKTPAQVAGIFKAMTKHGPVMATRAEAAHWRAVKAKCPGARFNEQARIITGKAVARKRTGRYLAAVTAGTSDIPVAEEAALTAEILGCRVERLWDVGVAGIHRLLDKIEMLQGASAIVVAAGMEGALPSVVSGLVACPVIAVPTSVGYGASFGGAAALLAMLNSCSPGVAVVNIDNGFGAGYLASMIVGKDGP
jgi:hypothetical protein